MRVDGVACAHTHMPFNKDEENYWFQVFTEISVQSLDDHESNHAKTSLAMHYK